MERKTYDVPEAAKLLGVGKTAMYEAVRTGEMPSVKIGARRVIPRYVIDKLLNDPEPQPAGAARAHRAQQPSGEPGRAAAGQPTL